MLQTHKRNLIRHIGNRNVTGINQSAAQDYINKRSKEPGIIVIGMYCAAAIQIGAWVIFTIEQKPMHPIGQVCLLVGSTVALLLGHFIGKRDLQRVRDAGAVLEGTRIQIVLIILCVAAVPGSLLLLVIISGI